MGTKQNRFIKLTVSYTTLIILSIFCLLPFLWMISTSLKTKTTMWKFPPEWIPSHPHWHNYIDAFSFAPFSTYITNTMTLEIFIIIGQLISCTLVAYGFARFKFRGREALFVLMLSTMLIPEQV